MAAPYWGQLPPPNITRTEPMKSSNPRREHLKIDTGGKGDRSSGQSFSRQNRNSIQTEASTQSPFASPVASTFRGDGLAPRPSSFQYNANDAEYNREHLERRKQREARNREMYDENPLPAAPDVPKPGPPLSYRYPAGNGAALDSLSRSRSTRKSEGPVGQDGNGLVTSHFSGRSEYPDPTTIDVKGKAANRGNSIDIGRDRRGSLGTNQAQSRKGSLSSNWADDKSPLQKLGLTLDSISKEEKRARMEEAERESKAGRNGERTQNSVRFRNRPVAKASDHSQEGSQVIPDEGLKRNESHRQSDQLERRGTVEAEKPMVSKNSTSRRNSEIDGRTNVDPTITSNDGAPERKASIRTRSAIPVAVGATAGAAAAGVTRRTSNKIRKEPPGDPWASLRAAAEKQYQQVSPRRGSTSDPQAVSAPLGSHPQITQDKDLPSLPQTAPISSNPVGSHYSDPDDNEDTMKRGSSRKIEQVMGQKPTASTAKKLPPSQMYGTRVRDSVSDQPGETLPSERVTVNGINYAVPPTSKNLEFNAPSQQQEHHRFTNMLHPHRQEDAQGQKVYTPARGLDEWKKGRVVLLDGSNLDLDAFEKAEVDKDKAWWEAGNRGTRRRSSTKQKRAEAYDGEMDDHVTRFKPPLYLKSGPFLRYCGLRRERKQGRIPNGTVRPEREIWRGSVMIVSRDSDSSYELSPTLRLFLQPIDLSPPPPHHVANGELAPEYVDPIAGLSKIGRDGRTLYVRPVEHLEDGRDLSKDESDSGLFESKKTVPDGTANGKKSTRPNFNYDGEKAGKYKEVKGVRLHAEHGVTFWRFNLEVELREKQQRIAYRINRGPATAFWVPARGEAMNILFHSCNGFSYSVDPNTLSGPDPLWRDVLNTHQTRPFHVMLGGGDQVYNDAIQYEAVLFEQWTKLKEPHHKEHAAFTAEMQEELEKFYLERYSTWFSQGLFGLAAAQIPMINIWDDHDIIDGWGSYPHKHMKAPVMSGLGAVAFKYYMLFQHQSSIDEGEETEPSWILGAQPGPYIPELSRSVFTFLGRSIAFLGLDCRTERMYDEVVSPETYDRVFARLETEIVKGQTKHLIVLLGVPVAYPRMVWLENILTSRLMEPVKALGRAGLLGKGLLNHLDGGVEILDDLDDHWTAKHHKDERHFLIEELQELAAEKSVRITFLGGDVHLAAIGQFYSNPKLGIPKDKDHRYMPNVISSAIVNTPPPDTLADLLNKRNKVHHLDELTDEDMIPVFTHDVTGKPRNNKRLLNRRNWCSIREYDPELTPPPTPEPEYDGSPSPPPKREGLIRRLSRTRGPSYRPDASAPPFSSAGFFNRRTSVSTSRPASRKGSIDSQRSGVLTRTLSLTRKDFMPANLFRRNSKRKSDSGGINGYGEDSEEDDGQDADQDQPYQHNRVEPPNSRVGLRGGGGEEENSYFPALMRPIGSTRPGDNTSASFVDGPSPLTRPNGFNRTPTGLSAKQLRRLSNPEISLEGGLDICLNVEVSSKNADGITVPYRLLVPQLFYEEEREGEAARKMRGGMKRWLDFVRKGGKARKIEFRKQQQEGQPAAVDMARKGSLAPDLAPEKGNTGTLQQQQRQVGRRLSDAGPR